MPTSRRPRLSASFAFASASAWPVPRAGIDARTTVKPSRAGHAIGSDGFGCRRGCAVVLVVVVVGVTGGAGGAVTTGDVATIVFAPLAVPVSRAATIPAVAEPAATRSSSSDTQIQSPG